MVREPWRTRLLFLSFAVNLVTIPMIGLGYMTGGRRPMLPPGPPRPQVMIERLATQLPADDRAKFRAAVDHHIESIEVARASMEAARRDMMRSFGSAPFDPAAVQAALHRWQAAWAAWSNTVGDAMLAGLGDITPEGRHQLAEAGQHRPRR